MLAYAVACVTAAKVEAAAARVTHADCLAIGRIAIDLRGKCKACGEQVAEPQSGVEEYDGNPWIDAMND